MQIPTLKVYAVIVSHNGSAWICRAIESLQQSAIPVSIVVVDNSSEDATDELVRRSYRDVMLFCMPSNLGFGAANNHGIRYALSQGADYVILLNQDARVASDTIEALVNLMEEKSDFGIISPLQLDYQGSGLNRNFVSYLQGNDLLMPDALLGRLQEVYEVPFVNAAAWLVRGKVFETVGGFDPIFFMYGEDNDYCCRARYRGFKVGIAPKKIACHRDTGSSYPNPSISEITNRLFIQAIHLLKRPDRFFIRNIPGLFITWFRMALHACIEFDFRRSYAALVSFLKAVFMLCRIWKHYRICKLSSRPWL